MTWLQIEDLIKNKDWSCLAKHWKSNRISVINLKNNMELRPADKSIISCHNNVPNNFDFIRTIVQTNGNCYNCHLAIKVKEERK